jgi:putative endonuclease
MEAMIRCHNGAMNARPAAKALPSRGTTKARGDRAEQLALEHLQHARLQLVQRNFKTPGRGGGEIDLIMREPDGTLVFVEVRARAGRGFGGAAASVGFAKQRRIVFAARHYLMRLAKLPPCRFDVVLVQGGEPNPAGDIESESIDWLKAAFDASS